jgi:L-rhamnose mutarotase
MRALGALAGIVSFMSLSGAAVAADRSYTEGTVTIVSSLRTEPGMFDEYMKYLAGPYKSMVEAQKKAGIIVDYAIYQVAPAGPNDPDIYLTTTYKNMAALDDLDAKTDPITDKLWGSLEKSNAAFADRSKLRRNIGSQMMRELVLK